MRRLFAVILLILLLCGCSTENREITREEIIQAYEEAGYTVSSQVYEEKLDHGEIGYIQASQPNGDYIYFYIFESHEDAKNCKQEYYHPVAMGFFSLIYGDPSWLRCKVHGNIMAEYDDPDFYEVFHNLLTKK